MVDPSLKEIRSGNILRVILISVISSTECVLRLYLLSTSREIFRSWISTVKNVVTSTEIGSNNPINVGIPSKTQILLPLNVLLVYPTKNNSPKIISANTNPTFATCVTFFSELPYFIQLEGITALN